MYTPVTIAITGCGRTTGKRATQRPARTAPEIAPAADPASSDRFNPRGLNPKRSTTVCVTAQINAAPKTSASGPEYPSANGTTSAKPIQPMSAVARLDGHELRCRSGPIITVLIEGNRAGELRAIARGGASDRVSTSTSRRRTAATCPGRDLRDDLLSHLIHLLFGILHNWLAL